MVKEKQLETMRHVCAQMGAEITPGYSVNSYFTAAYKEAWDKDHSRTPAREAQAQIKAMAARFPTAGQSKRYPLPL